MRAVHHLVGVHIPGVAVRDVVDVNDLPCNRFWRGAINRAAGIEPGHLSKNETRHVQALQGGEFLRNQALAGEGNTGSHWGAPTGWQPAFAGRR
ncbi:hypothetical protein D3C87_1787460 [compost metagenome]